MEPTALDCQIALEIEQRVEAPCHWLIAQALAAERERCAKILDSKARSARRDAVDLTNLGGFREKRAIEAAAFTNGAAAIRAGGAA